VPEEYAAVPRGEIEVNEPVASGINPFTRVFKGKLAAAAVDMRGRGRSPPQIRKHESSQVIMVARSATGLARRERERRGSIRAFKHRGVEIR
jgi:hypothetical protein